MPNVDSVYIDLAIGMAVAFFLLSLVPSGLNEALAFVTRIRSKFLWAYLNQLFTAKAAGGPASLGRARSDAGRAAERRRRRDGCHERQEGRAGAPQLVARHVAIDARRRNARPASERRGGGRCWARRSSTCCTAS